MKAFPFSVILFLLLSLSACSGGPKRVDSKGLKSAGERVEELAKYFRLRTEVVDAEFDIFDTNLNSGPFELPAPTSRLYMVALLLKPEDIESWTNDVTLTSQPLNYEWGPELVKDNDSFTEAKGEVSMFTAENKELILYKDEAIIFIRIKQD